ncbi:caspase-8-like [Octopus vulgaris]|uniref:Caspase-8-like n=1 Tax=Octopus vulgaris TaxID=6645 RepID=A0AA36FJN8_OCTVU|nr:caspase-8-like [Octopus vulgaris]
MSMNEDRVYYIYKDQFQKLRVDFVKLMDDIKSFLDAALSNGLLTYSHKESIMSERDSNDQKRRLHEILELYMSMNEDRVYYIYKDQFQKLRVDFVKLMDDIKSFLDAALSNGLLTYSHKDSIMSERDSNDQKRRLHEILELYMSMNDDQVYYIYKDQFQKLLVDFVKLMDDIKSFLDEALSNGLLTDSNKESIMSERDSNDQKRRLHEILGKKLPDGSRKFVSDLEKSNHKEILELLDDPSVYPMKFKPHGRVILINNVKFPVGSKYNEKLGSEKDVEGIRELFKAFNFDVQLYSNKTAEEMKRIIEKASQESTAREDCFVMFLMSHGVRGSIIGTDGKELSYSTINTILKESYELKDKPKLIYVNTCQAYFEKEDVAQYFNVADLHVTFATVPESFAYRSRKKGSLFIISLLKVYENNKSKCDISSLSVKINSQVSKECKEINMDQISSCYSTFKRKVILRATDSLFSFSH